MGISGTDKALLELVKTWMVRSKKGTRTNWIRKSEILWAGEHYLLIRTGPKAGANGQERSTILYSREWLLLNRDNEGSNPMVALAVAAIDPVHLVWRANQKRVLHNTNSGRKLTKSVLVGIIEFCKEEDRLLPERERAESGKFDDANLFSQKMVAKAQAADFEICGALELNGVPFPVDHTFQADIGFGTIGRKKFEFSPRSERAVSVDVRDLTLSPEDFEILVEALGKIHKNIKQRQPVTGTAVPTEEDEEDEEETK